jgi:hypothetical protein
MPLLTATQSTAAASHSVREIAVHSITQHQDSITKYGDSIAYGGNSIIPHHKFRRCWQANKHIYLHNIMNFNSTLRLCNFQPFTLLILCILQVGIPITLADGVTEAITAIRDGSQHHVELILDAKTEVHTRRLLTLPTLLSLLRP